MKYHPHKEINMKISVKIYKQTSDICNFLEFLIKLFFTISSMLIFGIGGYTFSVILKIPVLWSVVITLGSSILVTLYLSWWIKNFWNFIYHNNIKQYIPKKKKKMRDR